MDITAICVFGFVVLGIYKTFELFVRQKERMALIERLAAGAGVNDEGRPLKLPSLAFKTDQAWRPLRISLLLIGVGLGSIIAFFVQYNLLGFPSQTHDYNWGMHQLLLQTQFILYFSFITIFGGLGLLIAYFIESKKSRSSKNQEE